MTAIPPNWPDLAPTRAEAEAYFGSTVEGLQDDPWLYRRWGNLDRPLVIVGVHCHVFDDRPRLLGRMLDIGSLAVVPAAHRIQVGKVYGWLLTNFPHRENPWEPFTIAEVVALSVPAKKNSFSTARAKKNTKRRRGQPTPQQRGLTPTELLSFGPALYSRRSDPRDIRAGQRYEVGYQDQFDALYVTKIAEIFPDGRRHVSWVEVPMADWRELTITEIMAIPGRIVVRPWI